MEHFSMWRSLWQGSITEAGNQKVGQHIIDLMWWWRKREAAQGIEPGLPMRQVYTGVKSAFPAMLFFSDSL
ncbi:hypothetical protein ACHAW6_004791 [Cyclotella cf. meneghiniana]